MKRRLLLGLLLVATLLSMRTLALANGVEQTWIPGIYDDGDVDDALALAGSKAIECAAVPGVPTPDTVMGRIMAVRVSDPETVSTVALSSRAPPLV